MRSQCRGHLELRWQSFVRHSFFLAVVLRVSVFLFFSASLPQIRPPFFPHCYHSVTGARMSLCGGSWLGCGDCKPWKRLTVKGLADHSGGPWTSWAPTFHSARCSCLRVKFPSWRDNEADGLGIVSSSGLMLRWIWPFPICLILNFSVSFLCQSRTTVA